MKKSFRIFSILIALGLLVGAIGIGSVLAGQVDLGQNDVLDSSYTPQAAVVVAENDVQWAAQGGEDTAWVRPEVFASFFIQDDVLEGIKTGTASWNTLAADVAENTDFTLATGGPNNANFTLTAADYDTTTSANTPLSDFPVVKVGGNQQFVAQFSTTNGTFQLLQLAASSTLVEATFKHHVRDIHTIANKLAQVTSTSDPQGEYVQIAEVKAIDDITTHTNGTAAQGAFTISNARTAVTLNTPILDSNDDNNLSVADVTVKVGGDAIGTAATAVENMSASLTLLTGVVTFTTSTGAAVALPAGAVTVTYKNQTADPTSRLFLGQVFLAKDAAAQGTNDDGVWVQDGDTVTVSYLDDDGNTTDTDTVKVDGQKPDVTGISPADGTVTNLTFPQVIFTVTDAGSGITSDAPNKNAVTITINGNNATSTGFFPVADGFQFTYQQTDSWKDAAPGGFGVVDGTEFQMVLTAVDIAGNTQTVDDIDLIIDTVSPGMIAVKSGIGFDASDVSETSNDTSSVRVQFTGGDPLDAATVASSGSDFDVDIGSVTAAVIGTGDFDEFVYLTVSPALAPDAKPEVEVVAALADKAGNAVTIASKLTATDGIDPAATITIDTALAIEDDKVKFTVSIDENLTTDGIVISLQGPAAEGKNGALTITSPVPKTREASETVGATTKTGLYGISVRVTDRGNNSADNLTKVSDEAVTPDTTTTVEKAVITLANGPLGDADFDGDLDSGDVTIKYGDSKTVDQGDITLVDATLRTVEVTTTTPADLVDVKVTYHYVADDTFEIDLDAPTVQEFDPADEAEIENASPFIRVIWDDDEYPGDSYTTITMSKAELTNPDGTKTDVLANFVTSDSKEYIWATSNMALGAYSLSVTGNDVAGNAKTDSASFTIKERVKFSVDLRPGWNMVSLPGSAANPAINSVIVNPDVDIVLGYDPTVPGAWLTATRDSIGNLSGTLTTIEGSKGYWMHTTSFDAVKVDIPALAAGAQLLPPSFTVTQGWNLVAVSALDLTTAPKVDEYFSGVNWVRAYSFDTKNNRFDGILPGVTNPAIELAIGKGYWVYFTEAGVVVP